MDRRDQTIAELRELVAKLTAQLERQAERIAELELALAKAKKDSSTSSKPPSSDIVKPPVKKAPGTRKKRKRGGQPGHQRQLREPLPPERVNQTFEYEIHQQEVKDRQLTPTDQFEVIQHIELLDSPIQVIEHRLRIYRTADSQQVTPDVPELKRPIFGPRMLAMIGWLKSRKEKCASLQTLFANRCPSAITVSARGFFPRPVATIFREFASGAGLNGTGSAFRRKQPVLRDVAGEKDGTPFAVV